MYQFKISYLISTYNSGEFLDRQLSSLFNEQTCQDFEVVIVNPNSPGTDKYIAEKWKAAYPDRVNYIFNECREWYGESWLRAWSEAKGDFVCNSNTDDFHHPDFTTKMYDMMKSADKDVRFGYGGIAVLDEKLQTLGGGIKPPFDFDKFTRECNGGPQVMWHNSPEFRDSLDWELMWQRAGQYKSAFDYYLWLYFMSKGHHGICLPEIMTYYVQRSDSIENRAKEENTFEALASISEFFPSNFKVGGALHEDHPEFSEFSDLPSQSEWVQLRRDRKR